MTQAIYGHASGHETEPGVQQVELVPVGYREDVLAIVAGDRTIEEAGTEETGFENIAHELARDALEHLGERQRYVVESRFGLGDGPPMTLEEIGNELGISRQAASLLGLKGLERLEGLLMSAGVGSDGDYDDIESRWTPEQLELQDRWLRRVGARNGNGAKPDMPAWTDEQLALQEEWFAGIREKQEKGEIAFVRGSLLIEPLPEEVEAHLERFQFGGEGVGASLRAALQAVKEARDPEAGQLARIGNSTRRANRLHSRVVSLEKQLAKAKEEFEEALGEGAKALSDAGYPEPEPQTQE